jgi:hypothetical protein
LIVTIGGPEKGYSENLELHVRATTEEATLVDRTTPVTMFNTNGRSYAAYWLYDTGCVPVMVETWLTLGEEKGPVASATIPFACGE